VFIGVWDVISLVDKESVTKAVKKILARSVFLGMDKWLVFNFSTGISGGSFPSFIIINLSG